MFRSRFNLNARSCSHGVLDEAISPSAVSRGCRPSSSLSFLHPPCEPHRSTVPTTLANPLPWSQSVTPSHWFQCLAHRTTCVCRQRQIRRSLHNGPIIGNRPHLPRSCVSCSSHTTSWTRDDAGQSTLPNSRPCMVLQWFDTHGLNRTHEGIAPVLPMSSPRTARPCWPYSTI